MRPLVSVIVPMRNVVPYVRDALDSICIPDDANTEFLVVDDGSTDGSLDIVRTYPDHRVRLLINDGTGISAAFNTGLKHARSNYLMRCDADDWFVPGRIARQIAWMEAHPSAAVCCGLQEICWEDGRVVLEAQPEHPAPRCISPDLRAGRNIPRMVTAIFRTDCLRVTGGCREWFKTCEDDDLMMRLGERFEVWLVPDLVYRVRLRDTSICRSTSQEELNWYVARAREFQRQRLDQGADALEQGAPPPVPAFRWTRRRPAAWYAQDYLFADAWRMLDRRQTGLAWWKAARALRFSPLRPVAWRQALRLALVTARRSLLSASPRLGQSP